MKSVKPKDIKHDWHLIDAKGKVLGRLCSEVAEILMGKTKNYYTPNLDTGDYVVIINAEKVYLSGKKEEQKKYYRHSGYPGGLYTRTASQQREIRPEHLIRHSIEGMLPKTNMGRTMIKKMFVYVGDKNPHANKFLDENNKES